MLNLTIVPVREVVKQHKNSMGIMWEGIILLEQCIAFLLREWQLNRVHNVFDVCDIVQHPLHNPSNSN